MPYQLRPLLPVLFCGLILAAGCSKPEQYDPNIHGPAVGGAGGAGPGLGGAGATSGGAGRGGGTDGPRPPEGFTCTPAAPCTVPGKPCLVGMTQCDDSGAATCLETTRFQANGSPCGMGGTSVCLDGLCSTCESGIDCPLDGQLCKRGVIECGSGKPECTEAGPAPNGTGCGQGMVCQAGSCGVCTAGDPCLPENPCHDGTLECAAGATCKDTGAPKAPGSVCGAGKVCNAAGACVACNAGMTCDVPSEPCRAGKIDCSSGAPTCLAAGNATNGKDCGSGKVCREGTCETCSNGMTCTPTNQCHAGALVCASGTPDCSDTGRNLANGTMCGTNQYCNNGACNACTPNVNCTPENRCKAGKTSCETGVSECRESGNLPDGRDCDGGGYCRDGGCLERKQRGDTCGQAYECSTKACVDGRCCSSGEKFCDGQCRPGSYCCNGTACNIPNGRGECQGGSCQRTGCNSGFEPQGNACARTCGNSGEPCCDGRCNNGDLYCDGTCKSKKSDGSGCGGSDECREGRCTSSICCRSGNKICRGRCVPGGDCCEDQCNGVRSCQNNRCECTRDCCESSDCGQGQRCESNKCFMPVGPGKPCSAAGIACQGGTCKNAAEGGGPVCCKSGDVCRPSGMPCRAGREEDCASGACTFEERDVCPSDEGIDCRPSNAPATCCPGQPPELCPDQGCVRIRDVGNPGKCN